MCERAALFHLVCVYDWSQRFVVLGEDEEVALPLLQSCTASYLTRNGVTIGVRLFCSIFSDLFGESATFIVLSTIGGEKPSHILEIVFVFIARLDLRRHLCFIFLGFLMKFCFISCDAVCADL